ncbi:MAG: hypothetical protein ACTSU5_17855 [Promethearchaeota archaeon]
MANDVVVVNVNSVSSEDAGEKVKKNLGLIRRALIEDIDLGLKQLKRLIEDEYPDILHKLSIPLIYNLFVKDRLRGDTIRQINLVLKAAEEYDGTNLDELTEKYFEEYFKHDVVSKHCKHDHPKFPLLKEITKTSFRARIIPAYRVLNEGAGETYNDLIKSVYKTRDMTRKALEEHLIIADKAIDVIEDNKDVVKGPLYQAVYLARNIRIIRAGYEFALQHLTRRLDDIFPGEAGPENDEDDGGEAL